MKKLRNGIFICICCGYKTAKKCDMPKEFEDWDIKPYAQEGNYRFTCTECGAFMYPAFMQSVVDAGKAALLYQMFAICPSASICYVHKNYTPSCEDGKMKPACILPTYRTVAQLSRRLALLEMRFPICLPAEPSPQQDAQEES